MRSLRSGLVAALLAISLATPAAQAASGRPAVTPLPAAHLEFGLASGPGDLSWMTDSGVPWKYRYTYLAGGLYNNPWPTWQDPALPPGQYALDYMTSSWNSGYIPVLPYYMLLQSHRASDEATDDYDNLNNPSLMRDYYANFTLLLRKAAQYGHQVVIHVEPDLWGYLQQRAGSGSPAAVSASVASSGNADVAAYADSVQGFGQALLHLRDIYAPNALMAVHASEWASLRDIATDTDPTLSAAAEADKTAAFLNATGSWDVVFNDVDDHDAGWWEANGSTAHWWDPSNSRLPNFARYLAWVTELHVRTGKPQVAWQVPVGNQYYLTENNTPGHYQDNVAQYFLGHPSDLFSAGLVAVLFGAGNAGQSTPYDTAGDGVTNNGGAPTTDPAGFCSACNTHTSSYPDDDGGYLRTFVGQYYASLAPPARGAYHPLNAPARILDTRRGGGPVGPHSFLDLAVPVPSNAAAAVLNVTVTDASAVTFVTLFPAGAPLPPASSLNVGIGRQVANLVQVELSGGHLTIYNDQGSIQVIADLQGWVADAPESGGAGLLQLLSSPARLLDTRPQDSRDHLHPAPLEPGETFRLAVPGASSAAILNLTATNPSAPGYLGIGGSPGSVSNLNYGAGDTRANRVFARVSGGTISITNGGLGTVDVLVDMTGFFTDGSGATTGALYTPNSPTRLLDTRLPGSARLGPGGSLTLPTGHPGAVAAAVNVTVTDATVPTYVVLYAGSARPPVSDVNTGPGDVRPNLVVVAVAADGSVNVFNSQGWANVIVDLEGIYS